MEMAQEPTHARCCSSPLNEQRQRWLSLGSKCTARTKKSEDLAAESVCWCLAPTKVGYMIFILPFAPVFVVGKKKSEKASLIFLSRRSPVCVSLSLSLNRKL